MDRIMKKVLKTLLLLTLPVLGMAQSFQRTNTALLPSGTGGSYASIVPNASITVCQYNTSNQCITPLTVYSDQALLHSIVQPIVANASGVYSYYVPSGTQLVEKVCNIYNQCSNTAMTVGQYGVGTTGIIANQVANTIPLASGPTTLGAPSHLTDNGSVINSTIPFTATDVSDSNLTPGNCVQADINGRLTTTTTGCGLGSGSVAGQANGVIPLATAATTITAQSHLDDGITTANIITASRGFYANVNKVINVMAPPYNAKSDCTTDNATSIQQAFTDAISQNASVYFPATGTGCFLTSTIVWKGTPFFGAGISATTIQGQPGQDVFQTPDGQSWTPPVYGTLVHDFKLVVDNSVDASGSTHGNNTFPNRIAGTNGGTTNLITPTISPGPLAFGTYSSTYANGTAYSVNTQCSGTISAGTLNQITLSGFNCIGANSGPSLANLDSWRVIGAPITVLGANTGGTNLVTTISAVSTDGLTLTMAASAAAAGTYSGTMLNPVNDGPDPSHVYWTIGNCGFAFPNSNGSPSTHSPNLGEFKFENIYITAKGFPWDGNHSCGMFVQAPPYAFKMTDVKISQLYGGYVEAFPATNPTGSTWTGDTSSYKNIDLQNDLIPWVLMGGNHRTVEGLNIYGTSTYQTLGPMWLYNPTSSATNSSATINRLYYECYSLNTGEQLRFSGSGFQINGGSLGQCLPVGYTEWNATNSKVNAGSLPLQIASGANRNTFENTGLFNVQVSDFGFANSVATNAGPNSQNTPRTTFANRPRNPVGLMTGCYIATGNVTTPYLNCEDLVTTCNDMGVMFNQPSYGSCVSDLQGTELPLRYFQSAGATTIMDGLNNGGVSNTWSSSVPRQFGINVPQKLVNIYVQARCTGCTTFTATLTTKGYSSGGTQDFTNTSPTLTFTNLTNWTTVKISNVDLSTTILGDVLDYRFVPTANDGTNYQIASITIEPLNQDQLKGLTVTGTGAGIPSGPIAGTVSGHVVTFADTIGTQQDSGTALTSLAPLASPAFTGVPTAPTPAQGTNTTQVATAAQVTGSHTRTFCGTTTTCSNTVLTMPFKDAWGSVALTAGTATVTGISPAFSSTTTTQCSCEDTTAPLQACSAVPASTSSVTANGNGTDTVKWHCYGN